MREDERFTYIGASICFSLLGFAFAPFDTQPKAALVVSLFMLTLGIVLAIYFKWYWEKGK